MMAARKANPRPSSASAASWASLSIPPMPVSPSALMTAVMKDFSEMIPCQPAYP